MGKNKNIDKINKNEIIDRVSEFIDLANCWVIFDSCIECPLYDLMSMTTEGNCDKIVNKLLKGMV